MTTGANGQKACILRTDDNVDIIRFCRIPKVMCYSLCDLVSGFFPLSGVAKTGSGPKLYCITNCINLEIQFFRDVLLCPVYTVMPHVTTFRSTTDHIYNGVPIRL